MENQDNSEKQEKVSDSSYCLQNQDDSRKDAKVSEIGYCVQNQDDSKKHAKVSDSSYCLQNQEDSKKHAKVSDSSYGLQNQDDSEKHSKISDSAYSNSYSNSQSRKSHSSKSTHSGSNSSGSSGYGEKQTSSSSKILPTSKRSRKRAFEKPALLECKPPEPIPLNEAKEKEDGMDTIPSVSMPERADDNITEPLHQDTNNDEIPNAQAPTIEDEMINSCEDEGFSCAISLHNGVVMYTTQNLSTNLGFPEEMWIGRSFIEFVHPRDRNTFTAQITKSLPLTKIVNGAGTQQQETIVPADQECIMACRIRRYRNLSAGFAIKQRTVIYVPFVLKFSFKEIKDDTGSVVYLIIKATPLHSAYKSPNEVLVNPVPFVIRHAASGALEHIDVESVPYLGYMPHDIHNKDALTMYHPDDLPELKIVYETVVKEGELAKSMPFRMRTQNGDYVKVKTEWTSFTNPWSMKLEFIIGKHSVLEGPATPNVYKAPLPPPNKPPEIKDETKMKIEAANSLKEDILKILNEVPTKPADTAKQPITKHVHDIATIMETLLEVPKPTEDLRIETQEGDIEQDTVMLGGISPHHEYKDSMSSSGTSYSYNQLNYNENLQRYFDSHRNLQYGLNSPPLLIAGESANVFQDQKWKAQQFFTITPLSPVGQKSNDSSEISPTSSTRSRTRDPPSDFLPARLTQSVLIQHNNDMEKELAKTHREGRSTNKTNRTSEMRQRNQKAHLARCNASFQPTQAGVATKTITLQSLKRTLENIESDIPAKQSCLNKETDNLAQPQPLPATTIVPVSPLVETQTSNTVTDINQNFYYPQNKQLHTHPSFLPWSYPPPLYGTVSSRMPYNMPATHNQPMMGQFEQNPFTPIDVTDNEPTIPMDQAEETAPSTSFRIIKSKSEPEPPKPDDVKEVEKPTGPSEEELYRTDGESTYSSFYSLSLNTGTSSICSNDPRRPNLELPKKVVEPGYIYAPNAAVRTPLKKFNRLWLNDIPGAPDLLYKYQVPQKSRVDTMKDDMEKIMQLSSQPALVNDQLAQLYRDFELEGLAPCLTLEEGFTTTSSSSGDDASKSRSKYRKRKYSKLNMIYEENAPLPPPPASEAPVDPSAALSEKNCL